MLKRLFFALLLITSAMLLIEGSAFAEKIVIVYTGDSHASLYPCRCPGKPNGGVARRATKIKELRKEYPNLLLVDSGNYFASGVQDPDSQSLESDKKRTEIYIKAMQMMAYDAVGVGKGEFNFGESFLKNVIKNYKFNFLSCNLEIKGSAPFLIKKLGKTKIGIIGVSPVRVKSGSKQDIAKIAKIVKSNLEKIRKKVDIVILLSQLPSGFDEQLLKQIEGVDIIISSGISTKYKPGDKINSTIYLKPYLWVRTLRVLELNIEDGKIVEMAVKKFPMHKNIPDDADIKSILPQCFQDKQCYQDGQRGTCKSPGEKNATCVYVKEISVPLTIIVPKDCKTCNVEAALKQLNSQIPGLSVIRLDSGSRKARGLIKKYDIDMLPVYLLGKEIAHHDNYKNLLSAKIIEKKDDNYYIINPFIIGVSYFLDRKLQKNRLDLFISLQDKATKNVLEVTKKLLDQSKSKFDFYLRFLAVYDEASGEFRARRGLAEIEEDKRILCIMKNYPSKWWDYLFCRMENFQSSWWDDCALELGMDADSIKKCAKSQQAEELLRANNELSKELQIYYGPLFLLDNREIFGATESTKLEALEKIIK